MAHYYPPATIASPNYMLDCRSRFVQQCRHSLHLRIFLPTALILHSSANCYCRVVVRDRRRGIRWPQGCATRGGLASSQWQLALRLEAGLRARARSARGARRHAFIRLAAVGWAEREAEGACDYTLMDGMGRGLGCVSLCVTYFSV